ncbi:MAG: hypothetical protein M3O46_07430 [Myxococcota bacterium]|nr:hypothetical protein [Myxococcota bacterium]
MSNFQSQLGSLAGSFADAVLQAIKGASLEELLNDSRPTATRTRKEPSNVMSRPSSRRAPGRLPRRSSEDIAKALAQVVALVKNHKQGLRAEQIRLELGMQAKEMPRVLQEGRSKRKLAIKGQKRATTYHAR